MYRQHWADVRPGGTAGGTRYTTVRREDVPRLVGLVRRQHRRRPPRGTGARRCCWWGEPGRTAPASPVPPGTGERSPGRTSRRLPRLRGSPVRHPDRGAPPYGTVVRPGRPRRGCTGSTARRARRPLPRVHDPAGDRDLAPRRDAVPSGNEFLMFLNPFPVRRGTSDAPYDPASRAYGGRTGTNSPASPCRGPWIPSTGGSRPPPGPLQAMLRPGRPPPGCGGGRRRAARCRSAVRPTGGDAHHGHPPAPRRGGTAVRSPGAPPRRRPGTGTGTRPSGTASPAAELPDGSSARTGHPDPVRPRVRLPGPGRGPRRRSSRSR